MDEKMTVEKNKFYFLWGSFIGSLIFFGIFQKFYPDYFREFANFSMISAVFLTPVIVISVKFALAKASGKGFFDASSGDIKIILNKKYKSDMTNAEVLCVRLIFLFNALVSVMCSVAIALAIS